MNTHSNPIFVIAEMSGNHNHSLDRALAIVDSAAACGAHALKIQTYTADTITIDSRKKDFLIDDPKSLWRGQYLYDLYKSAYTPWEWHKPIFDRCKHHGIVGFSTPFDDTSVDFLESLNVPFYKIASFENTHLPLIIKTAKTGKPLIVSTGMASLAEIEELVKTVRQAGCTDLTLLRCTSSYPASPEGSNLLSIPYLKTLFGCKVGLSDHTMGLGVSVASVALGATVIEKHFTLSRAEGGVDSAFSMEPHELQELVIQTRNAWEALGTVSFGPTEQEKNSLNHRQSIYVTQDIHAGDVLTSQNIRIIRPGFGLKPKYWESVLGKSASKNIERGTPLSWELVSNL